MSKTITGSTYDLAQWFQQARVIPDSFGPGLGTSFDKFRGLNERERVSNEASAFTAWGMDKEGRVLLRTPNGRVLIELVNTVPVGQGEVRLLEQHRRDGEVMILTWLPKHRTTLYWTWFNKSSMVYLGKEIRAARDKRIDFDQIFIQA